MKRASIVAAAILLALASWILFVSLRRDWVPDAGFDVLGILWLLSNLPKLFGLVVGLFFLLLSGLCSKYAITGRASRWSGFSMRSEQERLLLDPRFFPPVKPTKET